MRSKVNQTCAAILESLKPFSQLPSNSTEEEDHQPPTTSVHMRGGEAAVGWQGDGQCKDKWPERYDMAVFLLTHFNVHYMSWIKNADHLAEYLNRFSCIYDRVIQLPEFDASGQVDNQLKDWLIDRAIKQCMQYQRQLVIKLSSLIGPTTNNKKMRISLMNKDNESSCFATGATTTTITSEYDDLLTDDESDEGPDNDEDLFEETAFGDLMTDDEDNQIEEADMTNGAPNQLVAEGNECGALGDETAFISATDFEEQNPRPRTVPTGTAKPKMVNEVVLGEVELQEGVAYVITLPKDANFDDKEIYLKLALIDAEAPESEHVAILISEAMITGFSGFTKRFNITLNEKDPNLPTELIDFQLNLKWQIDKACYAEMSFNPVTVLRKLPGAIFLLGDYYWYFYRGFYRWAAVECKDSYVRYLAIQIFHELALMMPPAILYDDMAPTFRLMYKPGEYPLPDHLPLLDEYENEYLCESVSQLDNVIVVFSYLFKEEQIEVVRPLVPFVDKLVRVRFGFTKRLVMMLRQFLSNYAVQELEEVVLPLAANLLTVLGCVNEPGEELCDPRGNHITWQMVNSLATHAATLVVECVQCARPQDWAQLQIQHPKMKPIGRLLEKTIQVLFTPDGIEFLKAIYMRLRTNEVLYDQHLAPFLTSARIKQYREWFH